MIRLLVKTQTLPCLQNHTKTERRVAERGHGTPPPAPRPQRKRGVGSSASRPLLPLAGRYERSEFGPGGSQPLGNLADREGYFPASWKRSPVSPFCMTIPSRISRAARVA